MWMPREPDVFGHPTSPRSPSVARTTRADLADLRPLDARHRIEIHAQFVGVIEIVGAHRVRMQLQAGEVGHPQQRGGIAWHDLVGAAAGRKAQRHHLDPWRPRFRSALLIEELPVDAVGVAHEHVGTPARPAQRAVRHREVIAREIQLGVAVARKEHFLRVGDGDLAIPGADHFLCSFRRHVSRASQSSAKRIGISARHAQGHSRGR